MIYIYLPLFIAEAVFAALFIRAGRPSSTKAGFAFKMCACVIYMANALYTSSVVPRGFYSQAVLCALAAGFVGDILLTSEPFFKSTKSRGYTTAIITGGICFLAGHIIYIYAFIKALSLSGGTNMRLLIPVWAGAFAVFLGAKMLTGVGFGKLTAPVILYASAITLLFSCAVSLALGSLSGSPLKQAAVISAPVLFIISDFSLALKYFDKERFDTLPVRIINLSTYFLSQMLFGLSIGFVGINA